MDITGVKGLFARAVSFDHCPTNFEDYVPLERKDGNQWVRIGDDGCLQSATPEADFVSSTICGLERLSGGCFKDDVSKDELAGHVYALGVVGTLVDDPEIHARSARLLGDLADHLIDNNLQVIDWDGRVAEHGRIFAMAFDDFPGLNAGMALGFLMTAANVTGREDIWDYVETCLVPEGGGCLPYVTETSASYLEHLRSHGLWTSGECGANFNNIAMHTLSLADIVLHARDPAIVDVARVALKDDVMLPEEIAIGGLSQRNPWYGLMWAQLKAMDDGPAFDVVTESACLLKQLPAVWTPQDHEPRTGERCEDRLGKPMFDAPLEPSERCATDFLWWKSPYGDGACNAEPLHVRPTTSLLLPYWLGRYAGFFDDAT
jgi:hypothetical protein